MTVAEAKAFLDQHGVLYEQIGDEFKIERTPAARVIYTIDVATTGAALIDRPRGDDVGSYETFWTGFSA